MSEWIKIRIKDFYKDAVGGSEYTYVSHEVYEALADTFRKEAHAEEMRDLRHIMAGGYIEGETEEQIAEETQSLEDAVIRQMELETLQEAVQSLTGVQRDRLHLYFFEG
ncbi:MAG: sigma-70 family RNA polymerase sigma factor, partial [Lachnospiraceae bacterium]|nr:sigma-70 family RNA polymerase sigma factor [Lachnospiraceae bacterium]